MSILQLQYLPLYNNLFWPHRTFIPFYFSILSITHRYLISLNIFQLQFSDICHLFHNSSAYHIFKSDNFSLSVAKAGLISLPPAPDYRTKAWRHFVTQLIAGQRVRQAFGLSVATKCVWCDGVGADVTEKMLQQEFAQYGKIQDLIIDRSRGHALVYFDQVPEAGLHTSANLYSFGFALHKSRFYYSNYLRTGIEVIGKLVMNSHKS